MGRLERLGVEDARLALRCLDLTDLGDACTPRDATRLVSRARGPHADVAAVCVWPQFVSQCADALRGAGVRVATVINFPLGGEDVERAVEDAVEALRDGASEIDAVIPYRALLRGDERPTREMLGALADHMPGDCKLKAILETGELRQPSVVRRAAEIAIEAGAHFLKTSTGKTPVSATPEAARILLETIKASGKPVGFKASGGIRTLADAQIYLALAEEIMGAGWAQPATLRFGASGLLDSLLSTLEGRGG